MILYQIYKTTKKNKVMKNQYYNILVLLKIFLKIRLYYNNLNHLKIKMI